MRFGIFRYPTAASRLRSLALIALLALFGPLLAPYDPLAQDQTALLQGSSLRHLLGTDNLGRDVLSRLLAGAPVSVFASLLSVGIGLALGVIPGLLSVFLDRKVEWLSLRLIDAIMTLPFPGVCNRDDGGSSAMASSRRCLRSACW